MNVPFDGMDFNLAQSASGIKETDAVKDLWVDVDEGGGVLGGRIVPVVVVAGFLGGGTEDAPPIGRAAGGTPD